jgi:hypothetical protein
MQRYAKLLSAVLLSVAFNAPPAGAQVPPRNPNVGYNDLNANQTRDQLSRLLEQYPPTVARVLQTDPALLGNKEYLSPYPALAAFIAQHPEIAHNTAFFLGNVRGPAFGPVLYERNPNGNTREIAQDTAIAFVLISIAAAVTWIVRSLIDYRRWARTMKIQTDIHSRLMDRLTSSEDLLAYIQSPAGKRLLEFAPLAVGTGMEGPTLSRILWSVQAGLVMGLAGIGLNYASGHIAVEAAQPFFVLGVLGMAVGGGFILSALASYVIARNMGLVHGTSETPPT